MSEKADDLVESLREQCSDCIAEGTECADCFLHNEAADRIAQLEAERDAAEAKLREAVEALRMMKAALHENAGPMALVDAEMLLNTTLARLTGETQDGGDDE